DAGAGQHRHREPRLPRHPAAGPAVARRRRGDRQGLDQSARRARASRRSGGRTLCAERIHPRDLDRGRMSTTTHSPGLGASFPDAWLLGGVRTPFADYNGALAAVSPIDLGIKAAREVLARADVAAADVGTVITGSMAQASFDAFMLPRHVGLYAGVPQEVPAHHVQRVCGTGIEVLMQAADTVTLGRADVTLCVGTESMSRNPIAAY